MGEIWGGRCQWRFFSCGRGRAGVTGSRVLFQLVDTLVEGLQGFGSSVAFEEEFDAEGEDLEAEVWVAVQREEGL